MELVSNYSQLPYRKWAPREKSKKDDVPDINRDTSFEPTVILKMLQTLRTDMFPVEGRQEDAEEFLSFILNRMNDEMIEVRKRPVPTWFFSSKTFLSVEEVGGKAETISAQEGGKLRRRERQYGPLGRRRGGVAGELMTKCSTFHFRLHIPVRI